jgi:hypothetical protein
MYAFLCVQWSGYRRWAWNLSAKPINAFSQTLYLVDASGRPYAQTMMSHARAIPAGARSEFVAVIPGGSIDYLGIAAMTQAERDAGRAFARRLPVGRAAIQAATDASADKGTVWWIPQEVLFADGTRAGPQNVAQWASPIDH